MNSYNKQDIRFLQQAILLARTGMDNNEGGPFGAIIVKNNKIIGQGCNRVIASNDPTAHAEVVAIREACQSINSFVLKDCIIYTSCEPCPMCLSAIYWARAEKFFFASTRKDAQKIGFDDSFLYDEIPLALAKRAIPIFAIKMSVAQELFERWTNKENKTPY